MELLRQTALSLYEEYDNFDVCGATELKITSIRAHGERSCPATYEIEDASEANVLSRISFLSSSVCPDHGKSETASLLLVSMWTSSNGNTSGGLGMSKTSFLDLIDALDLDRSVLQPIVNNVFGFLEFSELGLDSSGKSTSTYFLADAQMKLIWSFNFATSETKVILILRRAPLSLQDQSLRVVADLLASLRQQRENIFDPYTLLSISLVRMVARECKSSAKTWMLQRPPDQNALFEQVTASKSAVKHAAAQAQSQSQLVSKTLLLSDRNKQARYPRYPSSHASFQDKHTKNLNSPPTSPPATGSKTSQILSIRAQEESRLSREMAQTSRDLAESAKRDTASMKTITVMAMAFLPGTFFAALFSVPSLRWDSAVVVSDRFWVYWVFTLPVTACVFLVWLVLSYDDGFRTAVDEYQRRKRAGVGGDGLRDVWWEG